MHEVLVNPLGGLCLPRKSVVRLTDHPDMTLDVYRGLKQQHNNNNNNLIACISENRTSCMNSCITRFRRYFGLYIRQIKLEFGCMQKYAHFTINIFYFNNIQVIYMYVSPFMFNQYYASASPLI